MTAAATIHPIDAPSRPSTPQPLVLIEGALRAALSVESITAEAPLDERTALLSMRRSASAVAAEQRSWVADLAGKRVEIVQPIALAGRAVRVRPLFVGVIDGIDRHLDASRDRLRLRARDSWSSVLRRMIGSTALEAPAGSPTVASLVDALSSVAGWSLDTSALPAEVSMEHVSRATLAGQTFGDVLDALCRDHHLFVRRALRFAGNATVDTRSLRTVAGGRRQRVALSASAARSALSRLEADERPPLPVKLIARAGGAVVESTFELVAAWDPAKESLADGEYARSTSGDFDSVANVFRLWALNEDGAYSAAPFDRGEPFDVSALFGDGREARGTPMRFGDTLTLDDAGRGIGAVVDTSIDAGATWTRYGGVVRVRDDHAAVYLDDDALPAAFIAAARVGEARVRVTATLRNPWPLEATRWLGNPFRGAYTERVIDAGDGYRHRFVHPGSRFHAAVRAGLRVADEADDRAAMVAWLAMQPPMRERRPGKLRIELAGATHGLRVGDQLTQLAGRRVGPTSGASLSGDRLVVITKLRTRWDVDRVEIDGHMMEG